jgi:hypothetical protein
VPASDPANGSSASRVSPLPIFFPSSQGPVPFRSPFLLTFGPDPYNYLLILFNDSLIRPRCSPITSRSWLALRFSSLLLRRHPHMLSRSTCRCFFSAGLQYSLERFLQPCSRYPRRTPAERYPAPNHREAMWENRHCVQPRHLHGHPCSRRWNCDHERPELCVYVVFR